MASEVKQKRQQMAVRVEPWVPGALDELTLLVSTEVGRRMTKGETLEKLLVDALLARGKVVER